MGTSPQDKLLSMQRGPVRRGECAIRSIAPAVSQPFDWRTLCLVFVVGCLCGCFARVWIILSA